VVDHVVSRRLSRRKTRHLRERFIEFTLAGAAIFSVAVTLGIVYVLVSESVQFFRHVTIIAIYLSEFAPFSVREAAKPLLELLSGVPTVVYGYFALLFITPLLQKLIPGLPGFNLLSAGLVMGIMIIPYVSSLSEDAMRAVPMSMREGSYAMGATRFQTAIRVVTPAALSGITAAYILGISRAVGETMILAVAAGMQPNLTWNPMEPAATITSFIVQVALGDLPHGSIGYQTIFAAGLTLMVLTLSFNILGHFLTRKYRQVY
jgi:phosphate transport system permease protein